MSQNTEYSILYTVYRKGFTLIELLVVISIIAVLVASATASWRNAQEKSRDGKRKTDLKAVQQALENYIQTNGKYPASDASGQIVCNITAPSGDSTVQLWGQAFGCAGLNYMQQLPKDPAYQQTAGYHFVSFGSPPTRYVLSADIENPNDPDKTDLPCTPADTPGADRDYCVTNP